MSPLLPIFIKQIWEKLHLIVFNGDINGPSTKDVTRYKRGKTVSSEVIFSNYMKFVTTNEKFNA
jgi:hypothetical protein